MRRAKDIPWLDRSAHGGRRLCDGADHSSRTAGGPGSERCPDKQQPGCDRGRRRPPLEHALPTRRLVGPDRGGAHPGRDGGLHRLAATGIRRPGRRVVRSVPGQPATRPPEPRSRLYGFLAGADPRPARPVRLPQAIRRSSHGPGNRRRLHVDRRVFRSEHVGPDAAPQQRLRGRGDRRRPIHLSRRRAGDAGHLRGDRLSREPDPRERGAHPHLRGHAAEPDVRHGRALGWDPGQRAGLGVLRAGGRPVAAGRLRPAAARVATPHWPTLAPDGSTRVDRTTPAVVLIARAPTDKRATARPRPVRSWPSSSSRSPRATSGNDMRATLVRDPKNGDDCVGEAAEAARLPIPGDGEEAAVRSFEIVVVLP